MEIWKVQILSKIGGQRNSQSSKLFIKNPLTRKPRGIFGLSETFDSLDWNTALSGPIEFGSRLPCLEWQH